LQQICGLCGVVPGRSRPFALSLWAVVGVCVSLAIDGAAAAEAGAHAAAAVTGAGDDDVDDDDDDGRVRGAAAVLAGFRRSLGGVGAWYRDFVRGGKLTLLCRRWTR
jgi:hypothetical protein